MSIDHIVGYEKMSGKRYDSPLPNWMYEQKLAYPPHPKHSELIGVYTEAKKQYDESVEILQSSFQRKWQDPENPQKSESANQCQQQQQEFRKALELAEETLRKFNNHTPMERVALYNAEIKEWETQLAEVQRAEREYIKELLDDPNAAAKRLERMVNGYSGEKAEYSPEQLSKLRSLKNDVETVEGQILSLQRDVERIRQLAAEQERKAKIQATMDAALPKFNEACARFVEAWEELQTLADEHGIHIVSPQNLQIPKQAIFRQTNKPHEGASTIHIS